VFSNFVLLGLVFPVPSQEIGLEEHLRSDLFCVEWNVKPSSAVQLIHVTDLPVRSARTNRLLVPSVKLSTVGGRAFPVAGPTIWNSLPDDAISAPSLSTFRQRLKTFLFHASFRDIITDPR